MEKQFDLSEKRIWISVEGHIKGWFQKEEDIKEAVGLLKEAIKNPKDRFKNSDSIIDSIFGDKLI